MGIKCQIRSTRPVPLARPAAFSSREFSLRVSAPARTSAAMLIHRLVAALFLGLVLPGLVMAAAPLRAAPFKSLEIVSKTCVHVFSVTLAETPVQREKGLMFVKHLPDGQGMLFDFKSEQDIAMWMKNTYIPLDMLFIRGDGRIARIAANTTPMSTAIIPSVVPVRAVLEVAGGTCARLGIRQGDRVAFPIFNGR
jgi:uncharacterized protein